MNLLARCIEVFAVYGANCASICMTYQPKLPKALM